MKKVILALALLLGMPLGATHANTMLDEPHLVIEDTSRRIMSLVDTSTPTEVERVESKLADILEPVVDFPSIAKAVMGKYYSEATALQQEEFAKILQKTMLELYAKILLNFEIANLKVQEPEKPLRHPHKAFVSMDVTAKDGKTYTMSYSMRFSGEKGWQVRNVVLDGINLGLTYRNQFNSAALSAQGDVAYVIAHWGDQMDTAAAQ